MQMFAGQCGKRALRHYADAHATFNHAAHGRKAIHLNALAYAVALFAGCAAEECLHGAAAAHANLFVIEGLGVLQLTLCREWMIVAHHQNEAFSAVSFALQWCHLFTGAADAQIRFTVEHGCGYCTAAVLMQLDADFGIALREGRQISGQELLYRRGAGAELHAAMYALRELSQIGTQMFHIIEKVGRTPRAWRSRSGTPTTCSSSEMRLESADAASCPCAAACAMLPPSQHRTKSSSVPRSS
jgi:hypothetical protein